MASVDVDDQSEYLSSEEQDEEEPVITFEKLIDTIKSATREAVPSSPAFNPDDPSAFQAYWQGVYSKLRSSIVSDKSIPEFLTEPPVKIFQVLLFDGPSVGCCPCSFPKVQPDLDLRKPDGVTKSDFMEDFVDYICGESVLEIFDSRGDFGEMPGAAVYDADWMVARREEGKSMAYMHYLEAEDVRAAKVWLYCCPVNMFEEKVVKAKI